MKNSFKQIYDMKNILRSISYILAIVLSVVIVVNIAFDVLLGIIFIFLSLLLIAYSYLSSITKISLLDDGIELKSFFSSVLLRYDYISEVIEPDRNKLKLLKKQFPEFSIFGKRGVYSTKQLENLFMYSYSNKYKDNLIIHYGIDYYMISAKNMWEFKNELHKKIKKED